MSGADESGEEFQTGRTNRAEDRTRLCAQAPEDGSFSGDAILVVEPASEVEDDFKLVFQDIHGVFGRGSGAGAGVVGFNPAVAVLSSGDPVEPLSPEDINHASSAGMFGKGIRGVVGQGDGRGYDPPAGDNDFGAGVVGRGSAGVIGYAPGADETPGTAGAGVFGQGTVGVAGVGKTGVTGTGEKTGVTGTGETGVHGIATASRGGVFEAQRMPQVRLLPIKVRTQRRWRELGNLVKTVPQLPKAGLPGDLMAVIDQADQCTLWFCVSNDTDRTARWCQVLLGPMISGVS